MRKLLLPIVLFICFTSNSQTPITQENISQALNLWYSYPTIAEEEYGHPSNWDVSNVIYMNGLFLNTDFNEDISNWDVSNVLFMNQMFMWNNQFNQDISNWDVSNVTDMSFMFEQSYGFNQGIENWDVSSVTDMGRMFNGAGSFNQDISNWDVSNVTNMESMFESTLSFNQPVGNWDIGNVINIESMFRGSAFNQDIGNLDISNISSMSNLFRDSQFNQPIGNWDVSNVTDMSYMFHGSLFNQDISDWNVSGVTTMERMFFASDFNQDISDWEFGSVEMIGMFSSSALSTVNFDNFLISIYIQYLNNTGIYINSPGSIGTWIGAYGLTYCDGLTAFNDLTSPYAPLYAGFNIGGSNGVSAEYDCSGICYITAPSDITTNCDNTNLNLGESSVNGDCSNVSIYNDSESSLSVGENIITWSATTQSGNTITDTQIVTLTDDVTPTIIAPSDVVVYTNSGCTATNVSLGTPEANDNCSVSNIYNDAQSTTFQTGEYTVIWTVIDESGNSATDTQIINVIDNVSPIVSCTDISLTLENGIASISPSDLDTGTYDYCGGVTLEIDQTEFNENHIGSNTIILTATDESGNETTCESIVTIEAGMSIDYDLLENITIYPNPSTDFVYINGTDKELVAIVTDLLGRQVLREYVTEKLDISCLDKGTYIINLSDGVNTSSHKIIKN